MSERVPEVASPAGSTKLRLEVVLSRLLRAGIFVSVSLMALGTLLSYLHHPTYFERTVGPDGHSWQAAYAPHSLREVVEGIEGGSGRALIVIGLLVLIATPVVRVAVSLVSFVRRRERIYAVLTALVFALLLASFQLGRQAASKAGERAGPHPVSIEEKK